MSGRSGPLDPGVIRDAMTALLNRSAASERLLDLLGYLDAERAVSIVQLVWSNGFADSGERLHLAITEGRLAGTAIDPIWAYEIVPGRSIGPFALGMTREQVGDLHIGPVRHRSDGSAFFPLTVVSEGELARWDDCADPGATVRCFRSLL
jgi:hypothetical protein